MRTGGRISQTHRSEIMAHERQSAERRGEEVRRILDAQPPRQRTERLPAVLEHASSRVRRWRKEVEVDSGGFTAFSLVVVRLLSPSPKDNKRTTTRFFRHLGADVRVSGGRVDFSGANSQPIPRFTDSGTECQTLRVGGVCVRGVGGVIPNAPHRRAIDWAHQCDHLFERGRLGTIGPTVRIRDLRCVRGVASLFTNGLRLGSAQRRSGNGSPNQSEFLV